MGTNFTDSLKANGVDTIVFLCNQESCIIPTTSIYSYVFWTKSNQSYLTKFSKYYGQQADKQIKINNFFHKDISLICDSIDMDSIVFSPSKYAPCINNIIWMKLNNTEFRFEVNEFEKEQNPLSYKVLFIDKFRSFLLEENESKWKFINLKSE